VKENISNVCNDERHPHFTFSIKLKRYRARKRKTKYVRPNVKDGTVMCHLILRKPIIPTATGGHMNIDRFERVFDSLLRQLKMSNN
jgi:hypothetical protein